jgi:uncharacterized protein YjiS (DUF1127 family)
MLKSYLLYQIMRPYGAENGDPRSPKTNALRALSNMIGHRLDLRDLRRLMALDEHILADIGLDHSTVLAEYRRLHAMSWTTRFGHIRGQSTKERLEAVIQSAEQNVLKRKSAWPVDAQVTRLRRQG